MEGYVETSISIPKGVDRLSVQKLEAPYDYWSAYNYSMSALMAAISTPVPDDPAPLQTLPEARCVGFHSSPIRQAADTSCSDLVSDQ